MLTGLAQAASSGSDLYRRHCSVCHQTEGKGGIGLALTKGKLAQVSDDYLLKSIQQGRPGRIMPAFDFLGDEKINKIVTYIRSWNPQKSKVYPTDLIAGNQLKGKDLFATHCASCHGVDGSGEGEGTGVTLSRERNFLVMPPAINNLGFLRSAPDAMIKYIVQHGRAGSIMPTFKDKLADEQINDLVAYVRSFEKNPRKNLQAEGEMEAAWMMESPYDFQTTVDNVKAALTGANFRIFAPRYVEEGLIDEFSHNTKQVAIRFCNFKALYSMLNIEPRLGTVLPCRITVLQDKSGKVLLVSANVSAMAYWFNNDELIEIGKAMEDVIKDVMEEATL